LYVGNKFAKLVDLASKLTVEVPRETEKRGKVSVGPLLASGKLKGKGLKV
jgi:hypothetical protein